MKLHKEKHPLGGATKPWLVLALALCLAIVAITAQAQQQPLNIRIGHVAVPTHLTPILFEKHELLKHYGQTYTVEPQRFSSSATQITALASGQTDIVGLAPNSLGAAIQNAHIDDIRVIGDIYQDGVEGYYTANYLVRKDSPIHTVEDLKGKVLATSGVGSAQDTGIRTMLRRHGLEDKRDYNLVEVQFQNMIATLREGKVDIGAPIPQGYYTAMKEGFARVLFTQKDALGVTQMGFWVARAPFLEKNRAALNDFFEDVVLSLHWFLDPAHRDEVIAMTARFNKDSPDSYTDWMFGKRDFYRDPQARPNLDALQANMQQVKDLGMLRGDASIDIKKYSDLSFVDEATKRVGVMK